MSNDETKLHKEDGAVAEAGAWDVEPSLDARGVGIRVAHATLSYVSLSSIEPNPFRDLNTYPYDKRKLEALERSIEHVGLWEGLIGRRAGHGYQLAFGHHRLEAARSRKLTTVPLIIRDLTDEEMVGFMGRENMEDFNSDFLVMLASCCDFGQCWPFRSRRSVRDVGICCSRNCRACAIPHGDA